jgi:hypothetical protein
MRGAGQPFLGVCRGFQEVNVAMGGTLHPEIRDLPGRMNHRMPPDGTLEEKFACAMRCALPGGVFARVLGAQEVMTNSLHGQGIATAPGADRDRRHSTRWHARGDPRGRCARLYPVGAMAPGIQRRDRPGIAPAVHAWAAR